MDVTNLLNFDRLFKCWLPEGLQSDRREWFHYASHKSHEHHTMEQERIKSNFMICNFFDSFLSYLPVRYCRSSQCDTRKTQIKPVMVRHRKYVNVKVKSINYKTTRIPPVRRQEYTDRKHLRTGWSLSLFLHNTNSNYTSIIFFFLLDGI